MAAPLACAGESGANRALKIECDVVLQRSNFAAQVAHLAPAFAGEQGLAPRLEVREVYGVDQRLGFRARREAVRRAGAQQLRPALLDQPADLQVRTAARNAVIAGIA